MGDRSSATTQKRHNVQVVPVCIYFLYIQHRNMYYAYKCWRAEAKTTVQSLKYTSPNDLDTLLSSKHDPDRSRAETEDFDVVVGMEMIERKREREREIGITYSSSTRSTRNCLEREGKSRLVHRLHDSLHFRNSITNPNRDELLAAIFFCNLHFEPWYQKPIKKSLRIKSRTC